VLAADVGASEPEFMAQAITDAGESKTPVVAFRRNRGEWTCFIRLEDFLKLLVVKEGW